MPETIRIADGIRLHTIDTDKFKTNYISVNLMVPLRRKTAAFNALFPRVLRRGSETLPDMAAISRALEDLYATNLNTLVYKRGEIQVLSFGAYVLDNSFAMDGTDITDGVLKMIADILLHPRMEDGHLLTEYVEREKQTLIDDIRAQINNKNRWAISRCESEMCSGEAFGVPVYGTVEEVAAVTPETLTAQYRQVLKNAEIEIYYVGRPCAALAPRLKELLAPVCHEAGEPLGTEVVRRAKGEVREIIEDEAVKQGKLSLGFRTGHVLSDGDFRKMNMFTELFGASPTSKLFMNVREKLSLCYYCTALTEAMKGTMIVASGIEVSNYEKAKAAILEQLEEVRAGHFTDEDVANARRSIQSGYRALSDTAASLESWYLGRIMAGLSDTPEEASAALENVTREDIMAVAGDLTLDTVYFLRGTLKDEGDNAGEEADDEE